MTYRKGAPNPFGQSKIRKTEMHLTRGIHEPQIHLICILFEPEYTQSIFYSSARINRSTCSPSLLLELFLQLSVGFRL